LLNFSGAAPQQYPPPSDVNNHPAWNACQLRSSYWYLQPLRYWHRILEACRSGGAVDAGVCTSELTTSSERCLSRPGPVILCSGLPAT